MTDVEVTFQGVTIPANTSGTVYVYEDENDDGGPNSVTVDDTTITYDTVDSVPLVDGQTAYTLSGFASGSGHRRWPRVELDNSDDVSAAVLTEAATVDEIQFVPTDPSGLSVAFDSATGIVNGSFADNSSGSGQEDEFRVYRSTADSPTFPGDFSLRETVDSDTTTFVDDDLSPQTLTFAVTAVNSAGESSQTTDSVALAGDTPPATTVLPDVQTADISPLDASVENELGVPQPGVTNAGEYRVEYRETGASAWTLAGTFAFDDADGFDIPLPEDGEQYDVRVRSQTPDVAGSYATVTGITLLPPAGSVQVASIGTTQATITWDDTADNEDAITVDRRRKYADGYGPYSEIASLAPDTTSYTDSNVVPGTTYQYRVSNVTEHVESSTTVTATTTADAPTNDTPRKSGWYIELTASDGNVRTFTSDGTPERDPSLKDLERVTVTVAKDDSWQLDKWQDADARVWQDGARLPVDTLVARQQAAGQTRLTIEGPAELYASNKYKYEFSNTDVHAAFADVLDDTSLPYTVVSPNGSTRQLAEADVTPEFEDYYEDPGDTTPISVQNDSVDVLQSCFVYEGENWGNASTQSFANGDFPQADDFSGTLAEDVVPSLAQIDVTFTLGHEIPSAEVGAQMRVAQQDRGGEWRVKLDGQTIYADIATGTTDMTTQWVETLGGTTYENDTSGESVGPPPTLSPGDHTITIECVDYNAGGTAYSAEGILAIDAFAIYDQRYAPSFPNSTNAGNDFLPGPQLYPDSIDAVFLHNGFLSATGAEFNGTFNDTSNTQAVALSNDYGSTYQSASNTDTLDVTFASPGPDIQLKVTLGSYGTGGGSTPTEGFNGQSLDDYTLDEDVRDSPPLTNDQFSGRYKDILTALTNRGSMLWAAEWDESNQEIRIRMSNVADLTSTRDVDVVDYEWDTETLGRQVERASIEGGAQTVRAESVTADTVNGNPLDRETLIPGHEQVRAASDGTVYTRGTDYSMNYVIGQINYPNGTNISDGESLEVDYEWKPEGDFAVGGFDDRNQLLETFVGASTDAICQSVAYYLVQELKDPVVGGTATVPKDSLPAGFSWLDLFAADPLPTDVTDDFYVENGTVTQSGIRANLQSRKPTGEIISIVSESLGSVEDRV